MATVHLVTPQHMENSNKKAATLSLKYIEVMAAMNGHRTDSDPTDPAILQIREVVGRQMPKTGIITTLFSNRTIVGRILACAESQIKSGKGTVKVPMDAHAYNSLTETASYQRPTVLFVCAWPDGTDGQVIFSKEAMSLICTAYWFLPDKKAKPATGTQMVSVEIPDHQLLDEAAIGKILDEIYS